MNGQELLTQPLTVPDVKEKNVFCLFCQLQIKYQSDLKKNNKNIPKRHQHPDKKKRQLCSFLL